MDDYKPIPLLTTAPLVNSINKLRDITHELQEMYRDIPEGFRVITVCAYCGSETTAPCCSENHHEDILIDGNGDEVSIPSTPNVP